MRLRLLSVVLAVLILLTFAACNRNAGTIQGNIQEIFGEEPGSIYVEFIFLDYPDRPVLFKLFPELAPETVERFTALVERGYYNRRNIHRVIEDWLIQGGSVNFDGTDGAVEEREFLEQELSPNARHFYGALSMAPNSSGLNYNQFFIVTNRNPVDIDADIELLQELLANSDNPMNNQARSRHQRNLDAMKAIPDNIKQQYLTRGGNPSLDNNNTVFGQLVSGHDVIDALNKVQTVAGNPQDDESGVRSKPLEEIIILSAEIIRIPIEEDEPEVTSPPRRGGAAPPPPTDAIGDLTERVNFDEPELPDVDWDDEPGNIIDTTDDETADNDDNNITDDEAQE
jgi:peptidyl-prolyl cis-trans isomerase B (cyclophilin B)